jgi:WD40 repeat protein
LFSAAGVKRAWDVSPDNATVAVTGRDGGISLWDVVSVQKKMPLPALGTNNIAVTWSSAGEIIAGSHEASEIRIWHLLNATLTTHPLNLRGRMSRWLFLPNTGTILIGANSGPTNWTFSRWDISTRREVSVMPVNKEVHSLNISTDERLLVVGTSQGEVSLFNLETGKHEASFQAHTEIVECLALLPGGKFLVTAGTEAPIVKVWDLATLQIVKRFPAHNLVIRGIAISPDGTRMATTSLGTDPIKLWDTKSWEEVAKIGGNGATLFVERVLPDGATLAARDANQTLHLWHAPSWDEIATAEKAQPTSW